MAVLPSLELLPPSSAGLPCHEVWIIEWIIFWVTDRHQRSGGCILRLSTLFDKFLQRWNSLRPARWHCAPYGSLGLYQHLWEKMFWRRWKYNTSSCSVESTEGQVPGSWIRSLIWRNLLEEYWSQQTFSLRLWACYGTPVQIFEDFGFGVWTGHSNTVYLGFRLISLIMFWMIEPHLRDTSVLSKWRLCMLDNSEWIFLSKIFTNLLGMSWNIWYSISQIHVRECVYLYNDLVSWSIMCDRCPLS